MCVNILATHHKKTLQHLNQQCAANSLKEKKQPDAGLVDNHEEWLPRHAREEKLSC